MNHVCLKRQAIRLRDCTIAIYCHNCEANIFSFLWLYRRRHSVQKGDERNILSTLHHYNGFSKGVHLHIPTSFLRPSSENKYSGSRTRAFCNVWLKVFQHNEQTGLTFFTINENSPALAEDFSFGKFYGLYYHFLWDHWAHCDIFENGVLLMYTL